MRSKAQLILQSEIAECGLACLCMIARYHGHRTDMTSLRHRFALSLKGSTLADLVTMADALSLAARPLRADMEHVEQLATPCILHWDLNHYVVLNAVRRGRFEILDPARGELNCSVEEFSNHFSGVVLELARTRQFVPLRHSARVRLRDLWSDLSGLPAVLGSTLVLTLLVQIGLILSPLFLRLVVDAALPTNDVDLLALLAAGFVLVQLVSAAADWFRSCTVIAVGQSLTMQMSRNIFRHLLRLETGFFEKRFVGDILSRMGSVRPIQEYFTEGLVGTLVDGSIAVCSVVLLFLFDPAIALIVIVALVLQGAAAVLLFRLRELREMETLVARAEEQSHLIESIIANKTIKLFNREAERETVWSNYFARVIDCNIRVGRIETARRVSFQFISSVSLSLVVYVGARQLIDGRISFGVLFAALLFRNYVSDRAASLLETGFKLFLLRVHLDRLGDLVLAVPEENSSPPAFALPQFAGRLTLVGVSFRYALNEQFILEDVNLDIAPGEFVAVVGPSGGGKTTLLKIILGLYSPSTGEVLIDGVPLDRFGLRRWRSLIGVVQQDDQLLAGTIAENIALFDPSADPGHVADCARRAMIHEDIMAMPMNYLSLVGDMGSSLSGGQRQRLLFARALYKRPQALFLDEGTANLDPQIEAQVAALVDDLAMTRVVVAHRPALVRRAERVVEMRGRRLSEINRESVQTWFDQQ